MWGPKWYTLLVIENISRKVPKKKNSSKRREDTRKKQTKCDTLFNEVIYN